MILIETDARTLAWCDPSPRPVEVNGKYYEIVVNRDYDEKRWTMVMELVVRAGDGSLWRAFYERGLTENQDQRPFDYHGDVEFERVIGQPKTVTEYAKWAG